MAAAATINREIDRDGDHVTFDFRCPGCHARGKLTLLVSEGMGPFACPEKCGSSFVMWQPPGETCALALKCVVQRVGR
jgi:hypothetical protein